MRDRARDSAVGRRKQAAGASHEALVDAHHDVALRLGILAHVDKIDPPAEVRNGRVEFGERTVSDWVGMLGGGGAKYYACEAKSIEKEYLPRAKVSPKQQAHLDVVARGGGLALLVVRFTGVINISWWVDPPAGPRVYAVPWEKIKWQVLKTAESASEADLAAANWLVAPGTCFLERFHPRGTPIAQTAQRKYARE